MKQSWLSPTLRTMSDILELEDNWNSYGAPPIGPVCVLTALEFLKDAMADDTPTPSVVPTSCGGVQIEWHVNSVDLEIEFYPNGKVGCWYETEEWGESFDDDDVKNLATLYPLVAKLATQTKGD